jgi:DNA-binding MarR family transcriptional regulator/N-acetylglutamate synthase-like GNAT family acetyltransferase
MPAAPKAPVAEPLIEAVRRFNRFYTKRIGVLDEGMVRTAFSLQEARVIYELGQADGFGAGELAARLSLDAGYLSRLVAKLESQGYLTRRPGQDDRRRSHVALTVQGRKAFRKLDEGSRNDVRALLAPLPAEDRSRLLTAMGGIERVLGGEPEAKVPFMLRPPASGDYGWVVHRHGILYNQEYGWDESFEGLVAEIVAEMLGGFDPKRERFWIAERHGEFAGCVFLIQNRKEKTTAQLRLLLVEPRARGLGIGRRLVSECTAFARQCSYRKIMLYTNSVLGSARRIYQAEGYRLVREEKHHSWGHDLVGQYWELPLK